MGTGALERIQVTPLKRIPVSGGDVMHAMKAVDPGYSGFGEAYFSWVKKGAVKGWKQHQRMILNLVVPVGEVLFVFYDERGPGAFREERIGNSKYARITVPPGIWFGFQGVADPASVVLNIASIEHDPTESLNRGIKEIPYKWKEI
jgi:dTDP-4-dehydrorhamnose 3,5-epimerase